MHEQMVPCMRPQDDNRRSNSENLGSANENLFSSLLKKLTEAELVRFSMRQHICLGRYMLFCPSVCLSERWIMEKRLKLGL